MPLLPGLGHHCTGHVHTHADQLLRHVLHHCSVPWTQAWIRALSMHAQTAALAQLVTRVRKQPSITMPEPIVLEPSPRPVLQASVQQGPCKTITAASNSCSFPPNLTVQPTEHARATYCALHEALQPSLGSFHHNQSQHNISAHSLCQHARAIHQRPQDPSTSVHVPAIHRQYTTSSLPSPPTQLRFNTLISECDSLNDLLDLWKQHGHLMRNTHKAAIGLRAVQLQQQSKFRAMFPTKAVQQVCQLQANALKTMEIHHCTFEDLRNLLAGWFRSGYRPHNHIVKEVVHMLELPDWALPQQAEALQPSDQQLPAHGQEYHHHSGGAGANRHEAGRKVQEPGGKLRAATLDDLAVVVPALRALHALDERMLQAIQFQITKRAGMGMSADLKSCARLAHEMALVKCDDVQVYSSLAQTAIRSLQSPSPSPPSPSDLAWLLSTLSSTRHPDTRLLSAATELILRSPASYGPHAPRLVIACTAAGHKHQMLLEVLGSLIASSPGALNIQTCGQICMSYSSLGWAPDALLKKISGDVVTALEDLYREAGPAMATSGFGGASEATHVERDEDSYDARRGGHTGGRMQQEGRRVVRAAEEPHATLAALVQLVHGMYRLRGHGSYCADMMWGVNRWLMRFRNTPLRRHECWRPMALLLMGCSRWPMYGQLGEVLSSTSHELRACLHQACADIINTSKSPTDSTATPSHPLGTAYLINCLLPLLYFQARCCPAISVTPSSPNRKQSTQTSSSTQPLSLETIQVLQSCIAHGATQLGDLGPPMQLSHSQMCDLISSLALLDCVSASSSAAAAAAASAASASASWPLVATCLQRLHGASWRSHGSGLYFWSKGPVQGAGGGAMYGPGDGGGGADVQLMRELTCLPAALDAAVAAKAEAHMTGTVGWECEMAGVTAYNAVVSSWMDVDASEGGDAGAGAGGARNQEPLRDEDLICIYQCFLACELHGMATAFRTALNDERLMSKASKVWGAMMRAQHTMNDMLVRELTSVLNQLCVPILDPKEEEKLDNCPVPVSLLVWHEGRLIALEILPDTLDTTLDPRTMTSGSRTTTSRHAPPAHKTAPQATGMMGLKRRILAARGVHLATISSSQWLAASGMRTTSRTGRDGMPRRSWALNRQSLVNNILRDARRAAPIL